jgi:hypothetical protein
MAFIKFDPRLVWGHFFTKRINGTKIEMIFMDLRMNPHQ